MEEEEERIQQEARDKQALEAQQQELSKTRTKAAESQDQVLQMKSAFNADRKQLIDKINDLEAKLTLRHKTIQTLENKIHMQV